MLEIQVEVGTAEQMALIRRELQMACSVAASLDPPIDIDKIVVPASFDDAVNQLQGRTSYRSIREVGDSIVTAHAKVIEHVGMTSLVISPALFGEQHDIQTRMSIYIHEFVHLINLRRLTTSVDLDRASRIYFDNLIVFADEYLADRKSFAAMQRIFSQQSELMSASIHSSAEGYIHLLADLSHKIKLRRLSEQLSVHRQIEVFLREVQPIFDALLVCTSHALALNDSMPELGLLSRIVGSPFITDETLALGDFIRQNFEKEDYEFEGGMEFIRSAMKVFGFEFAVQGDDLVCHVDW